MTRQPGDEDPGRRLNRLPGAPACSPARPLRESARERAACGRTPCRRHCFTRRAVGERLRRRAAVFDSDHSEGLRVDIEPGECCANARTGHWALVDTASTYSYGYWTRTAHGYSVALEPRGHDLQMMRAPPTDATFAEPARNRRAAIARAVVATERVSCARRHTSEPGPRRCASVAAGAFCGPQPAHARASRRGTRRCRVGPTGARAHRFLRTYQARANSRTCWSERSQQPGRTSADGRTVRSGAR